VESKMLLFGKREHRDNRIQLHFDDALRKEGNGGLCMLRNEVANGCMDYSVFVFSWFH